MIKYHFESPKEHINVWIEELVAVSDDGREKYVVKSTRRCLKKTSSVIDANKNAEVARIEYNILRNWMLLSKMKIYINGEKWGIVGSCYSPLTFASVDGHRIEGSNNGNREYREYCVKDKNGNAVFNYKWNPEGKIFMSPKKIASFEIGDPNNKYPFIALATVLNLIPTSSPGV